MLINPFAVQNPKVQTTKKRDCYLYGFQGIAKHLQS